MGKTKRSANPQPPQAQTPPTIPAGSWQDRAYRRSIQRHVNALCAIPESVSERWKTTLGHKLTRVSEGRGMMTADEVRALFILLHVAPAKSFAQRSWVCAAEAAAA